MLKIFISLLLFYYPSFADLISPDDQAPIAVKGDHNHKIGEWMLSLRYSQMNMANHFKGSKKISTDEILKFYKFYKFYVNTNFPQLESRLLPLLSK
ncbi:MAG: hypothetical protein OXJ52_04035 [Oligoflexia bacterium]|nr:hypothetical protein [Oligoflexia bacterium]